MSYREEYLRKSVAIEDVLDMVKDGDYIFLGAASSEPVAFFKNFHRLHTKRHGITIHNNMALCDAEMFNEKYRDLYRLESAFFTRRYREMQKSGMATYIPTHLRYNCVDPLYRLKRTRQPMNAMIVAVSPMDKHGYFTLGSLAGYYRRYIDYADKIIVEVNESVPRTFGDTYLHISEVAAIYESADHKLIYSEKKIANDVEKRIGAEIAELINDGDTIQLGIGGIPSACAVELVHKRNLGIHTEMLNDGLVDLIKAGAVTNRKKNYFPDKIVTTFTMGCKETYDFIDDNIEVLHLESAFVNSPAVISRNDNFVSINTALMLDLMGQASSEAIGTNQVSGVGGQTDMVVGAKESKGGRSIMALSSTREVKRPDGTKERISTIKPVLPEGTSVTLSRNDIDFVVTEYGVASLRGASLKERANSLISIAHPDFRDYLLEEAKRWYLI